MAIIIAPSDFPAIQAVYARLPEPKPTMGDFQTFVFENGLEVVQQMDLSQVSQRAVGAMDARDNRKHNRKKRWGV